MMALDQVIPKIVFDAAFALHQKKNTELAYSPFDTIQAVTVEDDPLWRCADGQVVFSSLEARNFCVASGIFRQLIPASSTDAIFDAAYELWKNEVGHGDLASSHLLAIASQVINVLEELANIIMVKNREYFYIFEVLSGVFPRLPQIRAVDVVIVVEALYESMRHDMVYGMIFNAIENRLQSEPQVAWDIWRITKNNMSKAVQNLHSIALQALMHTNQQSLVLEKARDDAEDVDLLIAGSALWALGKAIHVHKLSDSDLDGCIAILIRKTSAASTEIQQAAIRAVAHAALKDERLMAELVRLAVEHNNVDTLAVISNFLFMNQLDFPASSPYFKSLLESLVSVPPSRQDVIKNFDRVLCRLYGVAEYRPLALDCLTQWIIEHGGSNLQETPLTELFDGVIMQIANDRLGLQVIITRWLVAPENKLAVACGGLVNYLNIHGMKSPVFSPEVLNTFSLQDFKFLARRLLGFVVFEDPLLSLTFSFLEINNASEMSFGIVNYLLTEEVGRNYPLATMNALKLKKEIATSTEKKLFEQIYAVLLERNTANNNLPRLQELRPPVRLQRAITLKKEREMERTQESAREKSVLRDLFKEIPLKAGRGCFSVSNAQVGPTQYLGSFSHSVSLPKRALTDPVGYAIHGLLYRIAKRDDE